MYIATIGEFFGKGNTAKQAFEDAKHNAYASYFIEDIMQEKINIYEVTSDKGRPKLDILIVD